MRRSISEFAAAFKKEVIDPQGGEYAFFSCHTGISRYWRWESGNDLEDWFRHTLNVAFLEPEDSPTYERKRFAYPVYWFNYYREMKLFEAVTTSGQRAGPNKRTNEGQVQ